MKEVDELFRENNIEIKCYIEAYTKTKHGTLYERVGMCYIRLMDKDYDKQTNLIGEKVLKEIEEKKKEYEIEKLREENRRLKEEIERLRESKRKNMSMPKVKI